MILYDKNTSAIWVMRNIHYWMPKFWKLLVQENLKLFLILFEDNFINKKIIKVNNIFFN